MKCAKSFIRSLDRNRHLRLREGVHQHLKEREWLFSRLENDTVFLVHPNGLFGVGVRIEDIDWNNVCP